MRIRLRRIEPQEREQFEYDGWPLCIQLHQVGRTDEVTYAVLEYEYGENSAEGPSWARVEVE